MLKRYNINYVVTGNSASVLLGVVFPEAHRPNEVDIIISDLLEGVNKLMLVAASNKNSFSLETKEVGHGQAELHFTIKNQKPVIPVILKLNHDETKELADKKARIEDIYCYTPQKIFSSIIERNRLDPIDEFTLIEIIKKYPQEILSANYLYEQTALHYAVRVECFSAMEELILHGASLNKKDLKSKLPIDYAKPDSEMYQFLRTIEEKKYTGGHIAAMNNRIDVITLLAKQMKLEEEDVHGLKPIHLAISAGNVAMVTKLIEFKAAISPTKQGITPLSLAMRGGHASMVNFLITSGEPVTVHTSKGEEPLFKSAKPHSEIYSLLKRAFYKNANVPPPPPESKKNP